MHILPLATPHEWIESAEAVGLKLVLAQDYSQHLLPFWRTGWRAARVLLAHARVLTALSGRCPGARGAACTRWATCWRVRQ